MSSGNSNMITSEEYQGGNFFTSMNTKQMNQYTNRLIEQEKEKANQLNKLKQVREQAEMQIKQRNQNMSRASSNSSTLLKSLSVTNFKGNSRLKSNIIKFKKKESSMLRSQVTQKFGNNNTPSKQPIQNQKPYLSSQYSLSSNSPAPIQIKSGLPPVSSIIGMNNNSQQQKSFFLSNVATLGNINGAHNSTTNNMYNPKIIENSSPKKTNNIPQNLNTNTNYQQNLKYERFSSISSVQNQTHSKPFTMVDKHNSIQIQNFHKDGDTSFTSQSFQMPQNKFLSTSFSISGPPPLPYEQQYQQPPPYVQLKTSNPCKLQQDTINKNNIKVIEINQRSPSGSEEKDENDSFQSQQAAAAQQELNEYLGISNQPSQQSNNNSLRKSEIEKFKLELNQNEMIIKEVLSQQQSQYHSKNSIHIQQSTPTASTQVSQSKIQIQKKEVPEDFTKALREMTGNIHAQEFHKYCFQTLLKKKNKKFRNIYSFNMPLQKQQQNVDQIPLQQQTQQQINIIEQRQSQSQQQQTDKVSSNNEQYNLYRKLLSDLQCLDSAEVEQIIEQAQQETYPIVSAKNWSISDSKKGIFLQGKEANFQREIASLTKIMTAYTIARLLHELNIQHPENVYLRVSKKAAMMIGTTAFLRVDQRINIYDCLHALLLPSGNDAAIVLATAFGKWLYFVGTNGRKGSSFHKSKPLLFQNGANNNSNSNESPDLQEKDQHFMNFDYGHEEYIQAFVQEMNRQAKKLKLEKINFSNPHGLSEKANHASPQDICKIATYALKYDILKEIVNKKSYSCTVISKFGESVRYQWYNSNKLLNKYFQGVKTGITPTAGPCLCEFFEYQDFSIVACIMDSKNVDVRWKEMATLIIWAFDKHYKKQQQLLQAPFTNGKKK